MKRIFYFFIVFSLVSPFYLHAQQEDYYEKGHVRYENYVYNKNIRTVQLHKDGWELSHPVIELNGQDRLKLGFDDIEGYIKDFYYTFEHCNANWEPSGLLFSEFARGVPEDYISEYKYSRNTRQKYIHYNLTFPNDNIELIKSGNYIIKVYQDGDPEQLILTWRFMVTESQVDITADIGPATSVDQRYYQQEVDFTLRHDQYPLTNPYQDVHVVVLQNYRWEAAISGLKPVFVRGNELIYDHDGDNVFPGGNEFRFFDIKSLRYKSERIMAFAEDDTSGLVKVLLEPDQKRTYKVYLDQPDINGKMFIKTDDFGDDSEVDADYCYVNFTLSYPQQVANGDFYIFGELSRWDYPKDFRMSYNEETKAYEATVLLKQGYYNYMYAFLEDGSNKGDITTIEGTHEEAKNDYTILVYHRSPGGFFDRLIAVETFSSR